MINSHTSFGKLKEVVVGRELSLTKRLSDITFKQFYKSAINESIYECPKVGNILFDSYQVNMDLIDKRNKQLDDGPNITATCRSSGRIPTPLLRVLERRM